MHADKKKKEKLCNQTLQKLLFFQSSDNILIIITANVFLLQSYKQKLSSQIMMMVSEAEIGTRKDSEGLRIKVVVCCTHCEAS